MLGYASLPGAMFQRCSGRRRSFGAGEIVLRARWWRVSFAVIRPRLARRLGAARTNPAITYGV